MLQVVALSWHEGSVTGIFRLLDTPAGSAARRLYCAGGSLGASLRCWSTQLDLPNEPGCSLVGEDLHVITYGSCFCEALLYQCLQS